MDATPQDAAGLVAGKPRRRGDPLNARQAAFVRHYLENGGNATQAAISSGYSRATARDTGSRLLAHPDVAAALQAAREGAADRIEATAERIVLELARLAFVDPGAMFDSSGELLPVHRMPADVRRAVAAFDVEERQTPDGRRVRVSKVRMASKPDALRLLAQIRGLLIERVQHEGPQSVTVTIGLGRAVTPAVTLEPQELPPPVTETLALKGSVRPVDVHTENVDKHGGQT